MRGFDETKRLEKFWKKSYIYMYYVLCVIVKIFHGIETRAYTFIHIGTHVDWSKDTSYMLQVLHMRTWVKSGRKGRQAEKKEGWTSTNTLLASSFSAFRIHIYMYMFKKVLAYRDRYSKSTTIDCHPSCGFQVSQRPLRYREPLRVTKKTYDPIIFKYK